jgi:chromosome segregation ATPase
MNGTAESPPPLTPSVQQQRPSPLTLTTLPQVLSALSSLESEEAELSNSLSALLRDQEPIQNALTRLQSLLPRVDELHTEASALSRKVSVTARTAERVGGRVRTLDEEMRRVREASDRLQQVMELKVRRLFCYDFLSLCGGFFPGHFFGGFLSRQTCSHTLSTCASHP